MHTGRYKANHKGHHQRPRQKAKRIVALAIAGFFCVYIVAFGVIPPVYSLDPANVPGSIATAGQPVAIDWPATGQAAIGAIGYGTVANHNTSTAVPTASVIKVVTALAVLQKKPLSLGQGGPTLTISKADVTNYETYLANHGSVVAVRKGQKFSEYQLLEAMLVHSANNLADTLAVWAFGSLGNYRTYAASYVKRLGMQHTTIGRDASGLDPGSKSTADDLLTLGQIAMNDPVITNIVHQKSANIPGIGLIQSTNTLLGTDGIIGIKTGTDYQNRGSYLFASTYRVAADKPPLTIIGAVMGAPTSPQAKQYALAMLRSARKGFSERLLFTKGQHIGQYQPAWLTNPVNITVNSDVKVIDWYTHNEKIAINLNKIRGSKAAGSTVGIINIKTGTGHRIAIKAILATAIPKPSLWWRLTHPAALLKL